MNPRHRDRVAFLRIQSGKFERAMEVQVHRTGQTLKLSKPHTFLGSERELLEEAWPGDVVGLFDPGELRIGDTLFNGPRVEYQGIPRFAPEHFARVKLKDPMRRKHLSAGSSSSARRAPSSSSSAPSSATRTPSSARSASSSSR